MFTCFKATAQPPNITLKVGEQVMKYQENPKLLGLKLDRKLTMHEHLNYTLEQCRAHEKQLRLIASASFGPKTRFLRCFAMAFAESHLFYAASVWIGRLSKVDRDKAEKEHRRIAAIVAGLPVSTSGDGVLLEANFPTFTSIYQVECAKQLERGEREDCPYALRRALCGKLTAEGRIVRDAALLNNSVEPKAYHLMNRRRKRGYFPWTEVSNINNNK